MMEYWNQLKPRERMLVGSAGVITVLLLLYMVVLEPFMLKAENLEMRVTSQQKEIAWLKQAALEVAQLKKQSPAAGNARQGQSLLVVVDQSAKRNKLAGSMKRVEPDGSSRVRVWLERAPFDEVSKWMNELENKYNMEIETAVFDKTDITGLINARLVFLGNS